MGVDMVPASTKQSVFLLVLVTVTGQLPVLSGTQISSSQSNSSGSSGSSQPKPLNP